MEDALEECGVEKYWPALGIDYRDAGPELSENPVIIELGDDARDFEVAGVISEGYHIVGEGDRDIIMPARVSIYKKSRLEKD